VCGTAAFRIYLVIYKDYLSLIDKLVDEYPNRFAPAMIAEMIAFRMSVEPFKQAAHFR
jgi:hypothetical protein